MRLTADEITKLNTSADSLVKTFARNLAFMRRRYGYSQEYVSSIALIPRNRYSSIEKGTTMPDLHTVCIYAEFYKIGLANFITMDLEEECDKIYRSGNGNYRSNRTKY